MMKNNNKGVAMIVAVVMALVFFMLVLTVSVLSTSAYKRSHFYKDRAIALNLAEAGLADALYRMNYKDYGAGAGHLYPWGDGAADNPDTVNDPFGTGSGSYIIELTDAGANADILKATGIYKGRRRTIQVKIRGDNAIGDDLNKVDNGIAEAFNKHVIYAGVVSGTGTAITGNIARMTIANIASATGNYTVTITDTNGCIEIANCTVNANSGANFNYTVNNMTVNFTMLNQTGCISNGFLWDYGNGMSSIIATAPYTTYSNSGTYTACLQCDTLPSACIVCANITVPGNYSGSTLRINEIDNKYGISILPNPTKGNFTILITSLKLLNSQLSICNILGDIIYQSVITNIKSEIDLSSQLSGVYIVNISADYKTYHQKLLQE